MSMLRPEKKTLHSNCFFTHKINHISIWGTRITWTSCIAFLFSFSLKLAVRKKRLRLSQDGVSRSCFFFLVLLACRRTSRPTGPPRPIAPLVQQVDLNNKELQDSNRFKDAERQQAEVADPDADQRIVVDRNIMKIELSQVTNTAELRYIGT